MSVKLSGEQIEWLDWRADWKGFSRSDAVREIVDSAMKSRPMPAKASQ